MKKYSARLCFLITGVCMAHVASAADQGHLLPDSNEGATSVSNSQRIEKDIANFFGAVDQAKAMNAPEVAAVSLGGDAQQGIPVSNSISIGQKTLQPMGVNPSAPVNNQLKSAIPLGAAAFGEGPLPAKGPPPGSELAVFTTDESVALRDYYQKMTPEQRKDFIDRTAQLAPLSPDQKKEKFNVEVTSLNDHPLPPKGPNATGIVSDNLPLLLLKDEKNKADRAATDSARRDEQVQSSSVASQNLSDANQNLNPAQSDSPRSVSGDNTSTNKDQLAQTQTYVDYARNLLDQPGGAKDASQNSLLNSASDANRPLLLSTLSSLVKNSAGQLSPFEDAQVLGKLVDDSKFPGLASQIFDAKAQKTFVNAAVAARLASQKGATNSDLAFVSNAFKLATGLPGGLEKQEGPLLSFLKESVKKEDAKGKSFPREPVPSFAREWIEVARELSASDAQKKFYLTKDQATNFVAGMKELDKLLTDLDNFQALGLLNFVTVPLEINWRSELTHAHALAQKALRESLSMLTQFKAANSAKIAKDKVLASDLATFEVFVKRKLAEVSRMDPKKNPGTFAADLRECFESVPRRIIWKEVARNQYFDLKRSTGSAMFLGAVKDLRKGTKNPGPLAQLIEKSFSELRLRYKEKRAVAETPNEKTEYEKTRDKKVESYPSLREEKEY